MPAKAFEVGDRVRLRASFLRSTGQHSGHDACGKWNVLGVDGNFVIVDQVIADGGWFTAEELEADPSLRYRRLHRSGLERCK
jgi:hypothetical protein